MPPLKRGARPTNLHCVQNWRDPENLLSRAAEANATGQTRRAVQLCSVALNEGPAAPIAAALRLERARAHIDSREWARAIVDCRAVIQAEPCARAYAYLAQALLTRGDAEAALPEIEHALLLERGPPAWFALHARALSARGDHGSAVRAARRAFDREPSLRNTLLHALREARLHHELIHFAELELESAPCDAELWAELGLARSALGHSLVAIEAFRKAVALEPERTDANFGLGAALIRVGELEEGFRYLEHRQKSVDGRHRFGTPPWRGEPLGNARLYVWSEQGLGDTIQFARFVPEIGRAAKKTTFMVPRELLRLFRSNPELGPLVEAGHPGFAFADYQTLLMSLPHRLGVASIARAATPYLFAEAERLARFRTWLPRGPKVALAWQGNPRYAGEPWRSVPFAELAPLIEAGSRFALPGGQRGPTFISLQKNFGVEQLRGSPLASSVLDLSDKIDCMGDAFVDSLAVLGLVDVFITTDTALAHLAGAAGVRSWLLLCEVADWRWGVGSETTFWYPSVRLFRQTAGGDWAGVVRRVTLELEAALAR